jgi:hypothetical protein
MRRIRKPEVKKPDESVGGHLVVGTNGSASPKMAFLGVRRLP